MDSATDTFFDDLSGRGRIPMLARATGTIRFELLDDGATETWMLDIDRGTVQVSHDVADALCVVRITRALFDHVASGETNALAAMLRGDLAVEGDPELLVLVQRLFPGPASRVVPAAVTS